ncbi:hypothetical protein DMB66_41565 [Actinoplanes sp. ATCC 53533]|uniref:hypothetical protein n=1 Tax=Actinoplanes sp. ATCC 53533 TaxID=1288362 RepID=UPI000F76A695|nr:hypothetical protein [Actinoplanes sp. ATCC 53533]RSM51563.1 hypothetical protein DMB66_41565 [Actinoplanes sp. ATCC 53533]
MLEYQGTGAHIFVVVHQILGPLDDPLPARVVTHGDICAGLRAGQRGWVAGGAEQIVVTLGQRIADGVRLCKASLVGSASRNGCRGQCDAEDPGDDLG